MRPDHVLLRDIDDALQAATSFVVDLSKAEFIEQRQVRDAVMYELIVVGEAATRLSPGVRAAHPEVEWKQIIAFRNRATHGYFHVDWNVVFDIVTGNVPAVREAIDAILREDDD